MDNTKLNLSEEFKLDCIKEINAQGQDNSLAESTNSWFQQANAKKYSYHFKWLGRPIIQYPQDIVIMQELIWSLQPDLIIETGIAHGGSLIFSASMLELNASCGGPQDAEVLGIDIDIRAHNRIAIESHPMYKRISMIQGSSIAPDIVAEVKEKAKNKQKVLVCLDSNHTYDHVLTELRCYAPLVSIDSYCVVFDTIIDDLPDDMFADRPWGASDNPKTAVFEFLKENSNFEIDKQIDYQILISVAPDGYLKRIR